MHWHSKYTHEFIVNSTKSTPHLIYVIGCYCCSLFFLLFFYSLLCFLCVCMKNTTTNQQPPHLYYINQYVDDTAWFGTVFHCPFSNFHLNVTHDICRKVLYRVLKRKSEKRFSVAVCLVLFFFPFSPLQQSGCNMDWRRQWVTQGLSSRRRKGEIIWIR